VVTFNRGRLFPAALTDGGHRPGGDAELCFHYHRIKYSSSKNLLQGYILRAGVRISHWEVKVTDAQQHIQYWPKKEKSVINQYVFSTE